MSFAVTVARHMPGFRSRRRVPAGLQILGVELRTCVGTAPSFVTAASFAAVSVRPRLPVVLAVAGVLGGAASAGSALVIQGRNRGTLE